MLNGRCDRHFYWRVTDVIVARNQGQSSGDTSRRFPGHWGFPRSGYIGAARWNHHDHGPGRQPEDVWTAVRNLRNTPWYRTLNRKLWLGTSFLVVL